MKQEGIDPYLETTSLNHATFLSQYTSRDCDFEVALKEFTVNKNRNRLPFIK